MIESIEEQLSDDEEARRIEEEASVGDIQDILEELAKDGKEGDEWRFALRAPKRDLKAEAVSTEHLLFLKPPNPYCEVCPRVRMHTLPHRRNEYQQEQSSKDSGS